MYLDPHVAPQCCILLSCHWKNHASFILSPFQRELGGVSISSIMSRNNTRTSKAKPPTWLASMIEFPLCVVSWPSYDNTTTVTLMYMMKPPNFAKLINDKIFVILFETSHRTHVLVYLIAKLHLLFYIQVAITRFEQIIMPVESSSPRESQDPKEDCDHGWWCDHSTWSLRPSWWGYGFPQYSVWLHHVNGC